MFQALFLINIDTNLRNLLPNMTRQVEAHQQLNVVFEQPVEEEVGACRQTGCMSLAASTTGLRSPGSLQLS